MSPQRTTPPSRKPSRESVRTAQIGAARDDGRAAFRSGAARTPPPDSDASLSGEWQWGWDVAQVAATQGRGVALYSALPTDPDPTTVMDAYLHALRGWWDQRPQTARDDYPALPWSMHDLIGSGWINVHTARELRLVAIKADGTGRPVPIAESDYPLNHRAGDGRHGTIFSIGLWWNDRYVIEHWVRSDGFTPMQRLCWFGVELRGLRAKQEQHTRSMQEMRELGPARVSCYGTNMRLNETGIKAVQGQIKALQGQIAAFAALHGLTVPLNITNAGLVDPTTGAGLTATPVQLSLF